MTNENLPNESKIFVRDKMSDFEKLLFAQKAIKDLQAENKILKLENDALQRTARNFEELFTADKQEKKRFKGDQYYKHIQYRLLEMSAKVRRLRRDKEKLINEIAILKSHENTNPRRTVQPAGRDN